MAQLDREKRKITWVVVFIVGLVGIGVALAVSWGQPCGYSKPGGLQIPCSCLGVIRSTQEEDGLLSPGGWVDYCYGVTRRRVCFKEFEGRKPAKPYVCSEYPYEVRLTQAASLAARTLYPDSKFSYEVETASGERAILETREEVGCPSLRVQGFLEKIKIGGAAPTYEGLHFYAVDFRCTE